MTVESTTSKVIRIGNDTATVFTFPFVIYESTDLVVTHTDAEDVETVLTEGTGATNYSVTVASYPGAGSITYPASGTGKLATGESLTIKRVLTLEQTTNLGNQGGYFPEVQETQFDKGIMIDLQQQEEIDRSLKIPVSSSEDIDVTLPAPEVGMVLGWNADLTGLINVEPGATGPAGPTGPQGPTGASGSGTGDMLAAQNLADLADAATARTNLGVAIGTDVQAYSAKTAALAALTWAANKLFKMTGTGAVAAIDFLDEDNMISDSAAGVPSQQSVKAYVDTEVAAITTGIQSVTSQVFTATGTWTKPTGVKYVRVVCVGPGGGGGGADSGSSLGAGGGGAGGYSEKVIDVSAIASVAVTIGTGGAAGSSAGGNGGAGSATTSFGAHCTAAAGGGGIGTVTGSGAGGAGGAGASGDVNITGQAGYTGSKTYYSPGTGGAPPRGYGFGGKPVTTGQSGNAATGYGAGGAGAVGDGVGAYTGGAGMPGLCIVYEYK